ncbi:hypothetical protein ACLOJK_036463 [Asimina triloba]
MTSVANPMTSGAAPTISEGTSLSQLATSPSLNDSSVNKDASEISRTLSLYALGTPQRGVISLTSLNRVKKNHVFYSSTKLGRLLMIFVFFFSAKVT